MNKQIIMIEDFKQSVMFHKVRDREFSELEMEKLNIRGIYNMVGELESMGPEVIRSFAAGCVAPLSDEVAIIEGSLKDSGKGNPLRVVSVMVFRDRFAYGLFALKDGIRGERYLDGDGFAEPVLGLMN